MIPDKTGFLNLESIFISYFNPVTGKYEKAEIPEATIEILGDMPHPNGGNQSSAIEMVKIDQVNYANADMTENYFTITVNKQIVYGILIGITVLLILAAGLSQLILKRRKQDPTMKSIYRQIINARDINQVYRLFSAMINHCYNLSLKASSKNAVLNSLPDAFLAEQIAEVMDYMESSEEKKCADLKNKIKNVYRMITPKSQYLPVATRSKR